MVETFDDMLSNVFGELIWKATIEYSEESTRIADHLSENVID